MKCSSVSTNHDPKTKCSEIETDDGALSTHDDEEKNVLNEGLNPIILDGGDWSKAKKAIHRGPGQALNYLVYGGLGYYKNHGRLYKSMIEKNTVQINQSSWAWASLELPGLWRPGILYLLRMITEILYGIQGASILLMQFFSLKYQLYIFNINIIFVNIKY